MLCRKFVRSVRTRLSMHVNWKVVWWKSTGIHIFGAVHAWILLNAQLEFSWTELFELPNYMRILLIVESFWSFCRIARIIDSFQWPVAHVFADHLAESFVSLSNRRQSRSLRVQRVSKIIFRRFLMISIRTNFSPIRGNVIQGWFDTVQRQIKCKTDMFTQWNHSRNI